MAPATKRRKLSHSEEDSGSDTSFSEEHTNGTSDVSMSDPEHVGNNTSTSEDDDVEEETVAQTTAMLKHTASLSTREKKKTRKPSEMQLQGSVYTAETFKSNVFKLQVDELLEQVRLNRGKKETAAESAMHALKSLIEQIPNREPLLVRPHAHPSIGRSLTPFRSLKPRRLSNQPE